MRTGRRLGILLSLLLSEPAWPAENVSPSARCIACGVDRERALARYDDSELEALRRGDVRIWRASDDGMRLRAAVLIEAPPAAVWSLLTDYERWPDFHPGLQSLSVISAGGPGEAVRLRHHVRVLGLDVHYGTVRSLAPRQGSIVARLDPLQANDLETSETRWQLVPLDAGRLTLLEATLQLRTARWIPGPLERMLVRRSLPDRLRAFREALRSDPGSPG